MTESLYVAVTQQCRPQPLLRHAPLCYQQTSADSSPTHLPPWSPSVNLESLLHTQAGKSLFKMKVQWKDSDVKGSGWQQGNDHFALALRLSRAHRGTDWLWRINRLMVVLSSGHHKKKICILICHQGGGTCKTCFQKGQLNTPYLRRLIGGWKKKKKTSQTLSVYPVRAELPPGRAYTH